MRNLTDVEAQRIIDEIVKNHGPFEAHNIQISENVYTMGKESGRSDSRHGRFIALATSMFGSDLSGLRVLDLACMEGKSAFEFAKRGAEAVGIEVRDHHLNKARAVASALGMDNLKFYTDDVRNVTPEKYGHFDIVVCSGIVYHLDEPDVFEFIHNISKCAKDSL